MKRLVRLFSWDEKQQGSPWRSVHASQGLQIVRQHPQWRRCLCLHQWRSCCHRTKRSTCQDPNVRPMRLPRWKFPPCCIHLPECSICKCQDLYLDTRARCERTLAQRQLLFPSQKASMAPKLMRTKGLQQLLTGKSLKNAVHISLISQCLPNEQCHIWNPDLPSSLGKHSYVCLPRFTKSNWKMKSRSKSQRMCQGSCEPFQRFDNIPEFGKECLRVVVHHSEVIFVESCSQVSLSSCHAHGIGNSLSQRTCTTTMTCD